MLQTPATSRSAVPSTTRFGLLIHSITLITFYTASSVPTPLYQLYQARWSLSATTLTLIYGVYPLGLLVALLFGGKLSDHIGRKPVIYVATIVAVISTVLMLFAAGAEWLIASRIVLGLATGIGSVALGAALIDLDQDKGSLTTTIAPIVAMAIGAFGTAALIQLAPAPFRLVFILLIIAFTVQLLLTLRVAETSSTRPGALNSLLPSVAVPKAARAELLAVTPFNLALWALGGFLMSLMPSLITRVTGSNSAWLGGSAVAIITLASVVATLVMSRVSSVMTMLSASLLLAVGMAVLLLGAGLPNAALFVIGGVCAGFATGAGFLGAIRSIMPLAEPTERAGLMSAFFIEAYLANSLGPMLAGYFADRYDLMTVTNGYGAILIILALLSLVLTWVRHRRAHPSLRPVSD